VDCIRQGVGGRGRRDQRGEVSGPLLEDQAEDVGDEDDYAGCQADVTGDAVSLAFDFEELAGGGSAADGDQGEGESNYWKKQNHWELVVLAAEACLVGAGIGRDEGFEEVFLEGGDGGGGEGFAFGGRGDDRDELEAGQGGAWNVDALGVGTGVGWGDLEADVVDEVVEEADVGGGEAFELVAGAEGHAEPEAFAAGAGEKGSAGETLGVGGVGEIEVADVADVLYIVDEEGDNAAFEIEEVDDALGRAVADECGERQVAGEGVASEAADDDLFVGGGHGISRIVARKLGKQRKRCTKGSQFATAVLH
jgi:hypothetical protein